MKNKQTYKPSKQQKRQNKRIQKTFARLQSLILEDKQYALSWSITLGAIIQESLNRAPEDATNHSKAKAAAAGIMLYLFDVIDEEQPNK